MMEDMQLHGLSKGTQEAYVGAIRRLAQHYGKSPDQITEEELRQYFLYLSEEKQLSRSTCTILLCAVKFLYEYTLQREWPTLKLVRPAREKKLPVILSQEEVRQILGCIHQLRYRVCLSTIYACGLRISEGISLQAANIDSGRMLVHVHKGKGGQRPLCPFTATYLGTAAPVLGQPSQPGMAFSSWLPSQVAYGCCQKPCLQ
jgi:site-specific recombinase XerD